MLIGVLYKKIQKLTTLKVGILKGGTSVREFGDYGLTGLVVWSLGGCGMPRSRGGVVVKVGILKGGRIG